MVTDNKKALLIKTVMSSIFILLAVMFIATLFFFKGNMNTLISKMMKEQAGENIKNSMVMFVDSAFNYRNNEENYKITLLEFGATGCISCRMMEKVMEDVRSKYPTEIKVKFLNVLQPVNQDMMKYFGVAAIPTQVLLDISGKEVFRHTGYISFDDLNKEFQKINIQTLTHEKHLHDFGHHHREPLGLLQEERSRHLRRYQDHQPYCNG
jgi:thiol-disulfide isomerase/thioredoxin